MKNYLQCILLFCHGLVCGQVVTVSEEISLRHEEDYHLIGKMPRQTLVLLNKEYECTVQSFDADFKKIWEKEVLLDKRRPKILGVVSDTSNFHIVYQKNWKLETFIKIHTYDAAANLVDSMMIKNCGSSLIAKGYQFLPSDDHSKILLYQIENNRSIHAFAFDLERREVLWETTVAPEKLLLGRDEAQLVLGNNGSMHIIVTKENFKYKLEEHHYEVYYFSAKDKLLHAYTIDMQGHLSYDAYFDYDSKNERLSAAGLYSTTSQAWAEGLFYFSVNSEQPEIQTLEFHAFQEQTVRNFLGKDAPNKHRGINESVMQQILFRQDGGLIGIVERKKMNERPYTRSSAYYDGQPMQIIDYYYEDLMVFSIHPSGALHWTNVLYKRQFSQDQDVIFASYFPMKTSDRLRLLFNDAIQQENTVSEYVLRGNGKYERNSVMSTDSQQLRLRFQDAIQVSAKALIVPSEYRNRLRLVKIRFE
ncbi:MAG: hypothetical protein AAF738_05915 [Bacteroidota bacterium]